MTQNFIPSQNNNFPMSDEMLAKMQLADQMFAKYDQPQNEVSPAAIRVGETQSEFVPAYQSLSPIEQATNSNPLKKYKRKPGTWVGLPSGGYGYSPDLLPINTLRQVAVQAMTASDELILQNPDALFNGEAIKQILESCVPGLKDANQLFTPDVDVLMLAIRVATFGNDLEMESNCPNCNTLNKYVVDVRSVIGKIKTFTMENKVVNNDGLIFYIKPYNYAAGVKVALATYEEMKYIQSFSDDENIQKNAVRDSVERLSKFSNSMLVNGIIKVETPDGDIIDDQNYILEYIMDTDVATTKLITKSIGDLNNCSIDKNIEIECVECNHKWETTINFDPSHFFA